MFEYNEIPTPNKELLKHITASKIPDLAQKREQLFPSYITYSQILSCMRENDDIDALTHIITAELEDKDSPIMKRLRHTLKRITDKGYRYKSLNDMVEHAPATHLMGRLALVIKACNINIDQSIVTKDFSDTDWYAAIELTMSDRHPEIFLDKSFPPFAPYIDECIISIWTNVLLIATITASESVHMSASEILERESLLDDMLLEIRDLEQALTDERTAHASYIADHSHDISKTEYDALQQQFALYKKDAEKTRKNLSHTSANTIKKLENTVKQKEKTIASLEERIAMFETLFSENETDDTDTTDISILPHKNIVVVGGHENFIGFLKTRYPAWTYINRSDSMTCDKPELILICSNQVDHSLCHKVWSETKTVPFRYTKSGNVERFLNDAANHYAKLINKKDGAD